MTVRAKLLFLLGGSAAFDTTADEFVPAAGGRDASIALLLQGGRNWQKYMSDYVRPWTQRGVSRYQVIVPDEDGKLNLDSVAETLGNVTGIFIGGGHTPTYRRLYATEPIRGILQEQYAKGIPIAGCSAGALIAPEICALYPDETDDGSLEIAAGLGLVSNLVIGVHFTAQNALPKVLAAMAETHTRTAWGIDDPACVIFEDDQLKRVLGRSAYGITMTDFESRTYSLKERTTL